MKSGTYLYLPPIGIFGVNPEFFDSFDKFPKRITQQIYQYPRGEWMLYKADGDTIYPCDRKGRKISNKNK